MKNIFTIAIILLHNFDLFSQTYIEPENYIAPGFGVIPVCTGFNSPTAMAVLPDGRIIVTEQDGRVFLVDNGQLNTNPIFTFQTVMGEDRGLMGVAVDPNFQTNRYLYFYHTRPDNIANRISRIKMKSNSIMLDDSTKTSILDLDTIVAGWHNGGCMKFGIDGKLYISVGDNGQGNEFSQNDETYWGKMLRINKDGSIPEGNPNTTGSDKRKRIWAKGLRNPYTFDINKVTGQILINDVGAVTWEEINDATLPGRNFGWSYREGFDSTYSFVNPIHYYRHSGDNLETDSTGQCIAGGVFFDGVNSNYPSSYQGKYLFCNLGKWINLIDPQVPNSRTTFLYNNTFSGITYLTLGGDGNIYFFDRREFSLKKIVYQNTEIPNFVYQSPDTSVISTQSITLQAIAVSVIPQEEITYSWYRNGTLLSQTSSDFKIYNASINREGYYYCVACNSIGCDTSDTFFLDVLPFNAKPVPIIESPLNNSTYVGGQIIEFYGSASDLEDGTLNPSSFVWQLDFHHDDHIHPSGVVATGLDNGSFMIPTQGELSDDVFYTITLKVSDNSGQIGIAVDTIYPKLSTMVFNSNPQGIPISIDAPNITTPHTLSSTEGLVVSASCPEYYFDNSNGKYYYFYSWNDVENSTISFLNPINDTVLTANYHEFKDGKELNYTLMNGCSFTNYQDVNNNLIFSTQTPGARGFKANFNIGDVTNTSDFGTMMSTFLDIDTQGIYKFYLESNGKSELVHTDILNNKESIVSNVDNNLQLEEKSGFIGLKSGMHKLTFKFANYSNVASVFKVFYEGPGISKQEIPYSKLFVKEEEVYNVDSDGDGIKFLVDCDDSNSSIGQCTRLEAQYCGDLLTNTTNILSFNAVENATNYRIKLFDGQNTQIFQLGSNQSNFKLSDFNGVKYNTTYQISIKAYVNGAWTAYGPTCTISTPKSGVRAIFCGVTLNSLSDQLTSIPVDNATNYKYEAFDGTNTITYVKGSNSTGFKMSNFENILYFKTYQVRVAAYVNGVWQSFGSYCEIKTPSLTVVSSQFCSTIIDSIGEVLSCQTVSNATNYRYEAFDGINTLIYVRGLNSVNFTMSHFPGVKYNSTYQVRVSAYVNNSWTNYGPYCTVSTPKSGVRAIFCGMALTSMMYQMTVIPVTNATNYKYEAFDGTNTLTFIKGSNSTGFKMSNFTGVQFNRTYQLRVAALVAGTWQTFGSYCTISTPVARLEHENSIGDETNIVQEVPNANLLVYPNPTNGEFIVKSSRSGSYTITNDLGQIMLTFELTENNQFEAIIEGLENGIYFVNAKEENHRAIKKIVVLK